MVNSTSEFAAVVAAVITSVTFVVPTAVHAQAALDEIVVTAQRRTESLQDVPIAVEVVAGDTIQKQGWRALDEVALFTPTVIVEPEHLRPSMSVRGLGAATTDAFTVEQSTPIFLDGVHFARTSMIKLSFLDVSQIEILKGPQPVYFGQNAIAGAFNITTRKPTPEWEGYIDANLGNFGTEILEAAAGGPVTETFGIRVAGKYDVADGYLKDAVSGDPFPDYENKAGRIIARWTPTERLMVTAKFDIADLNKGAEGVALCQRAGITTPVIDEQSVWFEPPLGTGSGGVPHTPLPDCEDKSANIGRSSNGPFFAPTGSFLENERLIAIDIRDAGNALFQELFGINMTEGFEKLTPWSTYLDLEYELENGIVLNSLTSYDEYQRVTNRENRYSMMVANIQYRDHEFRAASQELRASSPSGGTWEWMVGAYMQDISEEYFLTTVRGNVDQQIRYKDYDATGNWRSVFANLVYNGLLDGKASISIGARYSRVEKETAISGFVDTWILEDINTGEPFSFPFRWRGEGFDDVNNPYNGAAAIGYTRDITPFSEVDYQGGPWDGIENPLGRYEGNEIDPQIVLSYQLSDDHTFYGKYAESFKAGGADASLATVPTTLEEFEFDPEYASHWELGAKGRFLDGRARYDISAFITSIEDLQIGTTQALAFNSFIAFGNAGEQEVKGIEFAVDYAATDRLTLSLGGALLDNVMVDFLSTCTEVEFENPDTSGCDVSNSTIDRSGTRGANAPEWKFVLFSDYEIPVWGKYLLGFDATGYISDGYITDNTGFSKVNMMDDHGDLNLQVGFGDVESTWRLSAYARNLFEARTSYHPENDIDPSAMETRNLDTRHFTTYGVKFRYNF